MVSYINIFFSHKIKFWTLFQHFTGWKVQKIYIDFKLNNLHSNLMQTNPDKTSATKGRPISSGRVNFRYTRRGGVTNYTWSWHIMSVHVFQMSSYFLNRKWNYWYSTCQCTICFGQSLADCQPGQSSSPLIYNL